MLYRSRAPLRLGLAGGGTDVSPYSELFGGNVLNATIDQYAYATIIPKKNRQITIHSIETKDLFTSASVKKIPPTGTLMLSKAVYNRIVRDYVHEPLSFDLTTNIDAPPGSGLGSSSTLTVTILAAFAEWLKLPLGDYDIARIAYEIERLELKYRGGKQDQYAATFGGVNFMEFSQDDTVIVNPLRIKAGYLNELETCLTLYYTGTSRLSSEIIRSQQANVSAKSATSITAMHKLKEQAIMMKTALLKGSLNRIGEILDYGWNFKKQMANTITNPAIDEIYTLAKKAGASGGKITGAGGGGYLMLYCPKNTRFPVIEAISQKYGGEFKKYSFTQSGVQSWRVD